MKKLEEFFSLKVTELENANDEIAALKQEREALIANVGEENDLNRKGAMDEKGKLIHAVILVREPTFFSN